MSERETFVEHRLSYLIVGDLDKPFHQPECECDACEGWRAAKGRPTHKELRDMDAE